MKVSVIVSLSLGLAWQAFETLGLQCYSCMGHECSSGRCEGYYCRRGSLIESGVRKYRYHCDDDPTIPAGCHDIHVWGYVVTECYCDEGDLCTSRFDAQDALDPPMDRLEELRRPPPPPKPPAKAERHWGGWLGLALLGTVLVIAAVAVHRRRSKTATSPRPVTRALLLGLRRRLKEQKRSRRRRAADLDSLLEESHTTDM